MLEFYEMLDFYSLKFEYKHGQWKFQISKYIVTRMKVSEWKKHQNMNQMEYALCNFIAIKIDSVSNCLFAITCTEMLKGGRALVGIESWPGFEKIIYY